MKEDTAGSFVDYYNGKGKNYYDDADSTTSFRAELLNAADVSYLGPIFIGEPKSQGGMVVYDTGSDWLTVKACFTKQHCNEEIDKEATIKKMNEVMANMTSGAQGDQNSKKAKTNGVKLQKRADPMEKMMDMMN